MANDILNCSFLYSGETAIAAEPDSLTGTLMCYPPNGPGSREVIFHHENERVIGFIESNSASGRFVGNFNGKNLEFTAVLEFGDQPMAAVYKAIVDNSTMSGTIATVSI